MHCELKFTTDTPAELARVAAAVAVATGRDVEAETAADGVGYCSNLPGESSHEGGKARRSLIFSSRLPAFMFNFEHDPAWSA